MHEVAYGYDGLYPKKNFFWEEGALPIAIGEEVCAVNSPNLENRYVLQSSCEPS